MGLYGFLLTLSKKWSGWTGWMYPLNCCDYLSTYGAKKKQDSLLLFFKIVCFCFLKVPRVTISCSNSQSVFRLQRSDWGSCGFTSGWDLLEGEGGGCLSSFCKFSTPDGSARISFDPLILNYHDQNVYVGSP